MQLTRNMEAFLFAAYHVAGGDGSDLFNTESVRAMLGLSKAEENEIVEKLSHLDQPLIIECPFPNAQLSLAARQIVALWKKDPPRLSKHQMLFLVTAYKLAPRGQPFRYDDVYSEIDKARGLVYAAKAGHVEVPRALTDDPYRYLQREARNQFSLSENGREIARALRDMIQEDERRKRRDFLESAMGLNTTATTIFPLEPPEAEHDPHAFLDESNNANRPAMENKVKPPPTIARWASGVVVVSGSAATIYGLYADKRIAVFGFIGVFFGIVLLVLAQRAVRQIEKTSKSDFYDFLVRALVVFVVLYFMALCVALFSPLIRWLSAETTSPHDKNRFPASQQASLKKIDRDLTNAVDFGAVTAAYYTSSARGDDAKKPREALGRYLNYFNLKGQSSLPEIGEPFITNFGQFKDAVATLLRIRFGAQVATAYQLGVLLPTMTMMWESPGDSEVTLRPLRESFDAAVSQLPAFEPVAGELTDFRKEPSRANLDVVFNRIKTTSN